MFFIKIRLAHFYFLSVFKIESICSGLTLVQEFGFIFPIFSFKTSPIIGLTIETIVELNELVILALSSGFLFCTKIWYQVKRA
ncbi:TPA: hypothetical protein DEG21_01785 [Patescibacteria group bacterium]|nr:hypothetical protein [Candidatus Gracilibacteria bacterium]HBY74618.1 hypothetical protein [Candidatus Gracilibacteria bacterium]